MAFPATTGWNNLPNGNFSPVIFSQKAQLAFRKTSVAEDITNSSYFGEIANYGDSVRIIKEPEITVRSYTRGKQIVPQDLEDDDYTLVIDRANEFSFKIEDVEILYTGDINDVTIKYRYSQDYGRTVSDWEFLTKENISTARITPIRFFQIEYLLTYLGESNTKIHDINLIGDFQNVSLDYQKTNLFGVRENANSLKLNIVGDPSNANQFPTGGQSQLLTQQIQTNTLPTLTDDQKNQLFKPYQLNQVNTLLNKLSNDSKKALKTMYTILDDKYENSVQSRDWDDCNFICNETDLLKKLI